VASGPGVEVLDQACSTELRSSVLRTTAGIVDSPARASLRASAAPPRPTGTSHCRDRARARAVGRRFSADRCRELLERSLVEVQPAQVRVRRQRSIRSSIRRARCHRRTTPPKPGAGCRISRSDGISDPSPLPSSPEACHWRSPPSRPCGNATAPRDEESNVNDRLAERGRLRQANRARHGPCAPPFSPSAHAPP